MGVDNLIKSTKFSAILWRISTQLNAQGVALNGDSSSNKIRYSEKNPGLM